MGKKSYAEMGDRRIIFISLGRVHTLYMIHDREAMLYLQKRVCDKSQHTAASKTLIHPLAPQVNSNSRHQEYNVSLCGSI